MALANILSRRAILKGVPAAIAVGVVPVAAIAAIPAQTSAEQILRHAAEIERLLRETMPKDAVLSGVQWFAHDGETPTLWTSCRTDGGLYHMHPARSLDWKPHGKEI